MIFISYVNSDTIRKSLYSDGKSVSYLDYGQAKVCRIGKRRVLIYKEQKKTKYGNDAYRATYFGKNGFSSGTCRSLVNPSRAVEQVLRGNGIRVLDRKK